MVPGNHTSWLSPAENCPAFNAPLSLTFVYRLTPSALEPEQSKGMVLCTQLRGEKKSEKTFLKKKSLIKSGCFQENRQGKQASGRSACGRFPGLVGKARTCLRDDRPHPRLPSGLASRTRHFPSLIGAWNFAFGSGFPPQAGATAQPIKTSTQRWEE